MDRKNEGWQETLFLSTTSRAHIIYQEHTTTVVQKLIFVKPCKAFLKLANIYYLFLSHQLFVWLETYNLCSYAHTHMQIDHGLWTNGLCQRCLEVDNFQLKFWDWNLARSRWPGDLAGGQEMSTQTPRPEKIIYCFIRKSLKVFTEKSSEKSQGQRLILFIRF